MPSITIHNIDEDLKQRLKEQAAKHGCSVEEEARRILRMSLSQQQSEAKSKVPEAPAEGLGTDIHNLFKPLSLTDEELQVFSRTPGCESPCCNLPYVDDTEPAQ